MKERLMKRLMKIKFIKKLIERSRFKKQLKEYVRLCKIEKPKVKNPNKRSWRFNRALVSINYTKNIENIKNIKELKLKEA